MIKVSIVKIDSRYCVELQIGNEKIRGVPIRWGVEFVAQQAHSLLDALLNSKFEGLDLSIGLKEETK